MFIGTVRSGDAASVCGVQQQRPTTTDRADRRVTRRQIREGSRDGDVVGSRRSFWIISRRFPKLATRVLVRTTAIRRTNDICHVVVFLFPVFSAHARPERSRSAGWGGDDRRRRLLERFCGGFQDEHAVFIYPSLTVKPRAQVNE